MITDIATFLDAQSAAATPLPSPIASTTDTLDAGIVHGDCLDVLPRLAANSVDFVLTDPPYLVDYRSRDGRSVANDDNTRWLHPAFSQI